MVGAACAGYSFGAIWPHLVVLTSELFGSGAPFLLYEAVAVAKPNLIPRANRNSLTRTRTLFCQSISLRTICFLTEAVLPSVR